ncbi:MAG: [FeFe] hydrogenase H-cluster radical SAM maturase HydE, partial [Oscillospiraceae bacterium]|nr:[FeFe] hydrogenase H-cluster radical SAM maturase HydE [Oscillospiraceae bacterium]
LQGGEDAYFTDDVFCYIVAQIKAKCHGCAVTLSVGERPRGSLERLKAAGADRYLLRHETVSERLYAAIHPPEMRLESRLQCLRNLKSLGFQTGCGFMTGLPGQSVDDIVEDLLFIDEFDPEMVGIGPFLPHSETPYASEAAGDLGLTLNAVAIVRLMKPNVLLPATTAVESVAEGGRQRAVSAGANVVMPNLTTAELREKYKLYDGKAYASLEQMREQMRAIGREIVMTKGDYKEILP